MTRAACSSGCSALAGLLLTVFAGCSSPDDIGVCAQREGNLRGRVADADGAALAGATVGVPDLGSTSTDEDGCFSFAKVADGEHRVTARLDLDGAAAIAHARTIEVEGGSEVAMELPPSVELRLAAASRTRVSLDWTAFEALGFREYQVYRTDDAAEATSRLRHVTTDPSATTFDDDAFGCIAPLGARYLYQVLAMDEYGHLSTSDVLPVTLPLWDVDHFEVEYQLAEVARFTAPEPLHGVTWDGERLWLATCFHDPEAYIELCADNRVSLRRVDDSGAELARQDIVGTDDTPASGIAWRDGRIWMNYNLAFGGNNKAHEIDPATGELLRTLPTDEGTCDLAYDGSHLLTAGMTNDVRRIDPVDWSLDGAFGGPFGCVSRLRGVAHRPGEIWLAASDFRDLLVMGEDGTHLGIAKTGVFDDGVYRWRIYLTFAGDRLVIAMDDQVRMFDVLPLSGVPR